MPPTTPRAVRALAAAAAEAAVQEIFPAATPETRHAVSAAAAAATAAAATHFETSAPPVTPARAAAARRPATSPASGVAGGHVRKERTPLSLGEKISLIRLFDRGLHKTMRGLVDSFSITISLATARRICEPRERARLLARARSGEALDAVRLRRSRYQAVDKALRVWFDGIQTMASSDLPVTLAVLEKKAAEIAAELGLAEFKASVGFIQKWAQRHHLRNVALWGQGGSAIDAAKRGEERMSEIRAELANYDPRNIYNMDETGLQYRCLPNRAYIAAGQRRRARGTKAMKAKDRVALVLACNATGTHKVPISIIGSAAVPLCFKPPRPGCPLPYFSQKSAWMDSIVYEKWFNNVFVPAVRSRTTEHVILIVDNWGAHSELTHPQVKICCLPPNVTAIHQPLDAGAIACVKRRYKKRLISLVLRAHEDKQRRIAAEAAAAGGAASMAVSAARPVTEAELPSGRPPDTGAAVAAAPSTVLGASLGHSSAGAGAWPGVSGAADLPMAAGSDGIGVVRASLSAAHSRLASPTATGPVAAFPLRATTGPPMDLTAVPALARIVVTGMAPTAWLTATVAAKSFLPGSGGGADGGSKGDDDSSGHASSSSADPEEPQGQEPWPPGRNLIADGLASAADLSARAVGSALEFPVAGPGAEPSTPGRDAPPAATPTGPSPQIANLGTAVRPGRAKAPSARPTATLVAAQLPASGPAILLG